MTMHYPTICIVLQIVNVVCCIALWWLLRPAHTIPETAVAKVVISILLIFSFPAAAFWIPGRVMPLPGVDQYEALPLFMFIYMLFWLVTLFLLMKKTMQRRRS